MPHANVPSDAPYRHGIVIVSHAASRTGAPLIALNIARELVEGRGIPVVCILLSPGELESEFGRLGPTFVARRYPVPSYRSEQRSWARLIKHALYTMQSAWHGDENRFWRRISRYLSRQQIKHAICNTVVSGDAATRLKSSGVASIGLVHEMPHSIRVFGWTDQAAALIRGTDALVFACTQVQTAFTNLASDSIKPGFIFPQGINLSPCQLQNEARTRSRSALRAHLGLTSDDIMVLGCGYGDFRKGIDLFVQTAREMALSPSAVGAGKIVLAWVGQVDWNFRSWAEKDVIELDLAERLVFPGPQRDMAHWFSAADLFFQPSREDPFPTVVMEAMATGLPVVGFAGSGGIEDQLRDGGGVLVPYGDVSAAAATLRQLAGRPDERSRIGGLGQKKIALMGGYQTYVGNLIDVLDMKAGVSKPHGR